MLHAYVDMDVMCIVNCVDFSFWLITQLLCTNTDSLERSKPKLIFAAFAIDLCSVITNVL